MKTLRLLVLLAFSSPVFAQHIRQPSQMSIDGTYLFITLPSAASYPGFTAYTSDQGPVYSNGVVWASMSGGGIPPTIAANTVLCNPTALVAAPIPCAAFALASGTGQTSSITRTGTLAGDTQTFKVLNTLSATPGSGSGGTINTAVFSTTVGPVTGAADFNDLVNGLFTSLTLATNTSNSGVADSAFIAKTQKNSCYPAATCTKGYVENLVFNDYTGRATTGTYKSGGMVGSELDMRANNDDAGGSAVSLVPAATGIRSAFSVVYKSYTTATPDTPLTITGASGDGATATLTFASQTLFPQTGSTIVVAGMTPSGYNTAGSVVTASSATSLSYANTTTGFTSGGTAYIPAAVFGWGYRLDANANDTITVNRGFAINNLTVGAAAFTSEFATLATHASAFRMAGGQNIGFDTDTGSGASAYAKHQLLYDEGNTQLAYQVSGTSKFMVDDVGNVDAKGLFGLGGTALNLGTQTYGTGATVGACGSATCVNSILLLGSGAGVAPALKTSVTGTLQADLNFLIIPDNAAASSGLNGGNLVLAGSAPDGAHNYGSVTIQSSVNGATTINGGTSTGTTTMGNALSTFTLSAGTVSGSGWAALPAITATSVTTAGQLTSSVATGTAPLVVASTTNVANLNASTLSGKTHADPGPIGSGTPSTGAFTTLSATGLISPTSTVGIAGTTAADAPAAGSVGQVVSLHCPVGTAAAGATVVSMPQATPGVVTWTGHTFVPSSGLANYTCPINFPGGTPPSGVVAGTNYFIIGSSVSGDTFQIADTAAHALAGTNAVAFGSGASSPTAYIGNLGSTGTSFSGAGISLIAGDWDCTALAEYQELTSLTTSRFVSAINTAAATIGAIGTFTDNRTVSGIIGAANEYTPSPVVQQNISSTTTVFAIVNSTFTAGTMNEGGLIRCRRMR